MKNLGTMAEEAKARFVAQGHKDREKTFIVHDISTLRQTSTKLIISTAPVLNFRVFSHDVKQAYLHSKDKFTREIFLKPHKRDLQFFCVSDDEALRLLKPLYGVCDVGHYWSVIIMAHVGSDLDMQPMAGDPSLHMREANGMVHGMLGVYVDEFLLCGDESFQAFAEMILETFESRQLEWDNIEFLGLKIETIKGEGQYFTISQPEYIDTLKPIPLDVCFQRFTSMRGAVAWLAQSRPEICCEVNRAAQVTDNTIAKKHIKELNKAMMRVKASSDIKLLYHPLRKDSLHLRVYTDASFASNDDTSS